MLFKDLDSKWKLVDYSMSHSQLLIRSSSKKSRPWNIDIIFKGVTKILLPKVFEGIEIFKVENLQDYTILQDYHFISDENYECLKIVTANEVYYFINCMAMGVYKNDLKSNFSSLGRYDTSELNHELIEWYGF